MQVSKTDNRFKTGFSKPITGLPEKPILTSLLTILQLIAIRNSSDSNNIKPQAIKGLVKQNKFSFLH